MQEVSFVVSGSKLRAFIIRRTIFRWYSYQTPQQHRLTTCIFDDSCSSHSGFFCLSDESQQADLTRKRSTSDASVDSSLHSDIQNKLECFVPWFWLNYLSTYCQSIHGNKNKSNISLICQRRGTLLWMFRKQLNISINVGKLFLYHTAPLGF